VHQSGRPLVFFGNRGDIGIDVTVYGRCVTCIAALWQLGAESGDGIVAGCWPPMKNSDGRVLIEGYYDDVAPLGEVEKKALAECRRTTPTYSAN